MKKRNFYPFVLLFVFLVHSAEAQTFNGTGGPIPDNGTAVDFTITVSGLPASIDTSFFGLEELCLNIIHTWDSDLDISLIAPDGTSVMLISGVGGGGDNFLGTCLQSDATNSITAGNPPFFGTFRPMGQMGIVNNGQDPNGVWTLHIMDTYPFADQGTLLGWSISFSNDPATYFSFSASNLPIVKINTSGQSIPQGPKITAMMGIIDNGPGMMNHINDSANDYNGYIGIEIRGHSSSGFSQKQYNVETRDSAGDNLNVSILDMPAENDWVLYAPFNDKSLLRNALTYELTRQMGRYASRARFCELVLNGEYKGVYTFFEKVKRDSNRVDIASLSVTDTSGADVTGGYICSVDWPDNNGWISNYPPDPTNPQNNTVFYQYIYPQDDVILPQQEQYIQQFVDSFETALLSASFDDPVIGWRKYAGEGSFVDFFIMNELSKNVDGYRLSTFFYKEKITDGNKLHMGPVWDFNLAWHNADYCGNQAFGGWAYQITNYCSWDFPFWWRRLDQDTTFRNSVRCRWDELRATVLDTSNIFGYIDSIASLLNDAQERHYFIYPILGTYVWPNPSPLAQTYQEEVDNLKTWIGQRIAFMDLNLPGNCITTGLSSNEQDLRLFIYPNPANDWIDVRLAGNPVSEISVYSMMGDKVLSTDLKGSASDIRLDVSSFAKGAYFIKATGTDGKVVLSKFVKM